MRGELDNFSVSSFLIPKSLARDWGTIVFKTISVTFESSLNFDINFSMGSVTVLAKKGLFNSRMDVLVIYLLYKQSSDPFKAHSKVFM